MTIRSLKNGTLRGLLGDNTSAARPAEPTIGTASNVGSDISVTFTPATIGAAATGYQAVTSPSSITGTATTSPVVITGVAANTTYTIQVRGLNANGSDGPLSLASNSLQTLNLYTINQTFTSSGTYTVPAGKTQIMVVMVGGGGNGVSGGAGGAGSKVGAFWDYTVTPAATYSVVVGSAAGSSTFGTLATVSRTVATGPANMTSAAGGAAGAAGVSTGFQTPGATDGGTGGTGATLTFDTSNQTTDTYQAGGGGGGGGGSSQGTSGNRKQGGSGSPLGGGNGGQSGSNGAPQSGSGGNAAEANTGGGGGGGGSGWHDGYHQGFPSGSGGAGGTGKVMVYVR